MLLNAEETVSYQIDYICSSEQTVRVAFPLIPHDFLHHIIEERTCNECRGSQLRIIEMKKEVNELCHRLGEVGRYPLEFEQDAKERPDSPRPRNQP